jgi:hypothetical protein
VKLILCDTNPAVLAAWREQFAETGGVEIREEDVFTSRSAALLLPGNSFGFLDRGIELRATEVFGLALQDRIRTRIEGEFAGELLVGQAIAVKLPEGARVVVYAPLWRVPREIDDTVNVHLAVRGALRELAAASPEAAELAVPSLGVDPGGLHPLVSARQIRYAFEAATGLRGGRAKNLTQLVRRDRKLRALPGAGRGES